MNKITYCICSNESLCGIVKSDIKDIHLAWVALELLKKKWPEAMIQEVEETPMGGHIYHAIEIVVKRTPYAQHMETLRQKVN